MGKLPLFLALDVDTKDQALDLVKKSHPYIQGYKIGPRLFISQGLNLIEQIKSHNPTSQIFLDFKFYDIPSSTVEACRSCFDAGGDFVTVHSSVGQETLNSLAQWEQKLNQTRPFKILAVTVLSSVKGDHVQNQVEQLAEQVIDCGLTGLVCSPWDVALLRSKHSKAYLVTPGIRFQGDSLGDQKRVQTPEQALKEGSSALVMGRSLIHSKNLTETLKKLTQDLKHVTQNGK